MGTLAIALLIRPLIALVMLALIVRPVCWAAKKLIPEGRIKEILFRPIGWPRRVNRR
jgi:hypothetical protein